MQKRTFARTPTLPAMYLPKKAEPVLEAAAPAPKPTAKPAAKPAPKTAARVAAHTLPSSGDEFQRRLYDYDAKLAREGVCQPGELVKRVVEAGAKAGFDPDLATWDARGITLAAEQTKVFEAHARQRPAPPQRKEVA